MAGKVIPLFPSQRSHALALVRRVGWPLVKRQHDERVVAYVKAVIRRAS